MKSQINRNLWKSRKKYTGNPCASQTTEQNCNGGCAWNGVDICATGTTLADNTALYATASTSSNCNGNCTWTPNYECAVFLIVIAQIQQALLVMIPQIPQTVLLG